MATRILFVHPGRQAATHQELSRGLTAVAPPLWTALLAHHARREGHAVAVHDANLEGWDDATARQLLARTRPSLVVIMVFGHHPSASTQTMPAAGAIARDLKRLEPDLPVALGGLHPSALPERTLREEAADFVVQGEGPRTLAALALHLEGRLPRASVPGLWYREGGAPRCTGPAPPIEDLDATLEAPAWDLLPELGRYRAHTMHCFDAFERSARADFADVRSPYAVLATSVGCPHACHFCCIHALAGAGRVRSWSLETVLGWIDLLVERHGVRNLRLDDELFILAPRRVERFCDMLRERGHDLNLFVYGRVDTVRPGLLAKLKAAGVSWISLGIEAAGEQARRGVGKRFGAGVRETVRSIRGSGIAVMGNFIFGLPDDDLATMRATLELARELRCEFVNFYTLMAYPGAPLHARWAGQPDALPQSWEGYSQHGYETRPLPTRHLPAAAVLRFRDEAFRAYFTDPGYLAMMRARFGPRVAAHLEEMTGVRLRRRLLEEAP